MSLARLTVAVHTEYRFLSRALSRTLSSSAHSEIAACGIPPLLPEVRMSTSASVTAPSAQRLPKVIALAAVFATAVAFVAT